MKGLVERLSATFGGSERSRREGSERSRREGSERSKKRGSQASADCSGASLGHVTLASAPNDLVSQPCSDGRMVHQKHGKADMLALIRDSIIGRDAAALTPFGMRGIVYADYTASGRLLTFIEDYMRDVVYPLYANTHTEASATGFQTTTLREEARLIVSDALHAPVDEYATLFVGTGCTGAIDKLGRALGLILPGYAAETWRLLEHVPEAERPVVFHGPFEHHTNEVWWRESIATVVAIEEDVTGGPDLAQLEAELTRYAARPLKVGSFSAGSNVTGIRADTRALAELLHAHGALACFDFAGVGAYVKVDMRPEPSRPGADASIDALYMSPHKFVGGPGATGLLVARRSLLARQAAPTCPGGGTVQFVSPHTAVYEELAEAREDGGTPGILQAIRCGLAFKLKERVGCDAIEAAEQRHGRAALLAWRAHDRVVLMGADRSGYFDFERRVSIISFNLLAPAELPPSAASRVFLTKFGGARMLHPHFVVQLLNDVYGIQARSGCSCTGPYGHRLFGLADEGNEASATARRLAVDGGEHAVKPGWARVNFNYFLSEAEAAFIRDAVLQLATHGWRLLPLYTHDPRSGQFHHRGFERLDPLRSLSEFHIGPQVSRYRAPALREPGPLDYAGVLAAAGQLYASAAEDLLAELDRGGDAPAIADYDPDASAALREAEWWCSPSAALALLLEQERAARTGPTAPAQPTAHSHRCSSGRSSAVDREGGTEHSLRRVTRASSLVAPQDGRSTRTESLMHGIMRPRG